MMNDWSTFSLSNGKACSAIVHTDPHRLEQMVRNLCSNALKYTRGACNGTQRNLFCDCVVGELVAHQFQEIVDAEVRPVGQSDPRLDLVDVQQRV